MHSCEPESGRGCVRASDREKREGGRGRERARGWGKAKREREREKEKRARECTHTNTPSLVERYATRHINTYKRALS